MKAIVSVIGKDKKGIIANVSGLLFEEDVNIEDISQTIMQDYFTMIMLIDLKESADFAELNKKLEKLGTSIGVSITLQHEDVFNVMHRV